VEAGPAARLICVSMEPKVPPVENTCCLTQYKYPLFLQQFVVLAPCVTQNSAEALSSSLGLAAAVGAALESWAGWDGVIFGADGGSFVICSISSSSLSDTTSNFIFLDSRKSVWGKTQGQQKHCILGKDQDCLGVGEVLFGKCSRLVLLVWGGAAPATLLVRQHGLEFPLKSFNSALNALNTLPELLSEWSEVFPQARDPARKHGSWDECQKNHMCWI